jgi:hypothetical protein
MIFLDKLCEQEPMTRQLTEGCRVLRIHSDVLQLVKMLMDNDEDERKLAGAAPYIFFPSNNTWIEWQDERGHLGFYFYGPGNSVTDGQGFLTIQDYKEERPAMTLPMRYGVPQYMLEANPAPSTDLQTRIAFGQTTAMVKPLIFAMLAMINSPKVVRATEIDVSRINKKRQALGRYCFHPHHEVRLDIDKRVVKTVTGHGDGASKALHFVRAHLRFIPTMGQYVLVQPHWRGDPALGIRDTHYRVDRKNSKWP